MGPAKKCTHASPQKEQRPCTHGLLVATGKEKCVKKGIPEVSLLDCLSAVTIQRRVLHELLVGGVGDEEDPPQNDFLQLSRNIEHQ